MVDAATNGFVETDIGSLPSDWSVVDLSDVLSDSIKNGLFAKRDRFGTGSPFFNVADVYKNVSAQLGGVERVECNADDLNRYSLEPGDVIYVRSSLKREGIGHCCFVESVDEPSVYDCHLMRVRVDRERVDPQFLALYSLSHVGREMLIARSKTTTMTTLNQMGLGGFRVPLPLLDEQRAIAGVLRTVQRAKEATEKVIAAARQLKQSLRRHLFTFGPVPFQQADHVELQETEYGEMPSHWKFVELDELAKIGNGSTPKRANVDYWQGGNVPWLTSTKIHEVVIDSADEFVTPLAQEECHLPTVKAGSLLVAITGQGRTLGNAAMVTFDTCINQHLAYITFGGGIVPEFMLMFLQGQYQRFRQVASAGGSTRAALTCGFLKRLKVPVPPIEEQQAIADALLPVTVKASTEASKREAIEMSFNSLLHDLMTGQRRVHELDLDFAKEEAG